VRLQARNRFSRSPVARHDTPASRLGHRRPRAPKRGGHGDPPLQGFGCPIKAVQGRFAYFFWGFFGAGSVAVGLIEL
jgi:hypothetical protein